MIKEKSLPEEKYYDELRAGIVDGSYFSPLVIDGYFELGDVSGWNGSINNHTLSQDYLDPNNGDARSGNGFIKILTTSQCNGLIKFNAVYGVFLNGGFSSGNSSMKIHTFYQQNDCK